MSKRRPKVFSERRFRHLSSDVFVFTAFGRL